MNECLHAAGNATNTYTTPDCKLGMLAPDEKPGQKSGGWCDWPLNRPTRAVAQIGSLRHQHRHLQRARRDCPAHDLMYYAYVLYINNVYNFMRLHVLYTHICSTALPTRCTTTIRFAMSVAQAGAFGKPTTMLPGAASPRAA
jgi:hypothetical protein